ncbi:MAG: response regulator transcription factor [Anaerolineae bacterium]|nr:response regulator transcription factor [Anaerolineae bacterium]
MADGLPTKVIAKKVFVSEKTVEHMLGKQDIDRGLYRKLNVENRAAAAAWLVETQTAERLLVDYGRSVLDLVHQSRMNGLAQLAGHQAAAAVDYLKTEIKRHVWDVNRFAALAEPAAALLREQLVAHFERLPPEAVGPTTRPLIKELRDIAQALDAPALHAVADYGLGMMYYLTQQWLKSIEALERALPATPPVDQQLTILRLLALNWASLGEEKRFLAALAQGSALIDQGDLAEPQVVGLALEGFGRGLGMLKKQAAFDMLERAWQIYRQAKTPTQHLPLRFIQLARSELEVMASLQEVDRRRLNTHGQVGLDLAQELGYVRYADQIKVQLNGWP